MARPLKKNEDKRTIIIRVRLTAIEKTHLSDAAEVAGVTLSDLLRLRTLTTLPSRRKQTVERVMLIRSLGEVGKLGGNINQIAKNLNRERLGLEPVYIPQDMILQTLQNVDTLSNHLLKLIEHGN